MKISRIFLNLLFLTIILIIIESFSSIIIYYKEKKISSFFNPFGKIMNNFKNKQEIFLVNWDKTKDRFVPGSYIHKKYGKKISYKILKGLEVRNLK